MKTDFYLPRVDTGIFLMTTKRTANVDGDFPFVNYNNYYFILRKLKNIQVGYNPLGIVKYYKLGTDFVMFTAKIDYPVR